MSWCWISVYVTSRRWVSFKAIPKLTNVKLLYTCLYMQSLHFNCCVLTTHIHQWHTWATGISYGDKNLGERRQSKKTSCQRRTFPFSLTWVVIEKHPWKKSSGRTSLEVRWLRLQPPNAGGPGFILGQGTRSHTMQPRVHMLQLKILHTTTKIKDPVCPN